MTAYQASTGAVERAGGRRAASESDGPYSLPGGAESGPAAGRPGRTALQTARCAGGVGAQVSRRVNNPRASLEWSRPSWSGTLHGSVLRRLDVPWIADPIASLFLCVRRASPPRSGHVRADSGDAQDNRLSDVRNLVICSECWRDVKGGCAGCQRGELERLQKEAGDRPRHHPTRTLPPVRLVRRGREAP